MLTAVPSIEAMLEPRIVAASTKGFDRSAQPLATDTAAITPTSQGALRRPSIIKPPARKLACGLTTTRRVRRSKDTVGKICGSWYQSQRVLFRWRDHEQRRHRRHQLFRQRRWDPD